MGYVALRASGLKFPVLDKDGKPTNDTKVYKYGEAVSPAHMARMTYRAIVGHIELGFLRWEGSDKAPHLTHSGPRDNVVLMHDYIQGGKDRRDFNQKLLDEHKAKEKALTDDRMSRHPVKKGMSAEPSSGAPELTPSSAGSPGDATPSDSPITCTECEQTFKSQRGLTQHRLSKHPMASAVIAESQAPQAG